MPKKGFSREVLYLESEEELELLRQVADEYGVGLEPIESDTNNLVFLLPIAIFGVGAAVAGALASFVEKRKGGQMIDLRPGASRIAWRDPGVIYGLVVIVTADGTVHVEVHEPKGYFLQLVESVLGALVDAADNTAEAVKAVATTVVGTNATVTFAPVAPGA